MEDKIKQLENELKNVIAQSNFQIGLISGKIELLKQQAKDKNVKEDKK